MPQSSTATLMKLLTDGTSKPDNPVFIREILATQNPVDDRTNRVGDFETASLKEESDAAYLQRTLTHIEKMAAHASVIHLEDNFTECEEKSSLDDYAYRGINKLHALRPDCNNHVTRLSFNEYYFYPHQKRGPLPPLTFQALVRGIETIAANLPENLHLTLASFPLLDEVDRRVANMVIYVQCGLIPALRVMAKNIAAMNEPVYPGTEPLEYCRNVFAPSFYMALGDKNNAHRSMHFSSPIVCDTRRTRFWTLIDICNDLEMGYGKQALARETRLRKQHSASDLPQQITHIVISNSTFLYEDNTLSATVTHVDPSYHTLRTIASDKKWEATIIKIEDTHSTGWSELRFFPTRQIDKLPAGLLNADNTDKKKLTAGNQNIATNTRQNKTAPRRKNFRPYSTL